MLHERHSWSCLSVVLLLLAPAAVQANYVSTVLADNPIGYWRVGETGSTTVNNLGSAGAVADGTASAGVALGGVAGALPLDPNKAATFNGAGIVEIPAGEPGTGKPFDIGVEDPFTVEAWVKTTHDAVTIMGRSTDWGVPAPGWFFAIVDGGRFGIQYRGYDPTPTLIESYQFSAQSLANDVNWNHLVATHSGGWNVLANTKLYLNGVEKAISVGVPASMSVTYTIVDVTNNEPLRFGVRGSGASGDLFMNGAMDELAFYGSVLSAERIAAHWAARNDAPVPEPATLTLLATGLLGLLAYAWRKRR